MRKLMVRRGRTFDSSIVFLEWLEFLPKDVDIYNLTYWINGKFDGTRHLEELTNFDIADSLGSDIKIIFKLRVEMKNI
jgi:hypothetical protein